MSNLMLFSGFSDSLQHVAALILILTTDKIVLLQVIKLFFIKGTLLIGEPSELKQNADFESKNRLKSFKIVDYC
jgi:hypothetical protein